MGNWGSIERRRFVRIPYWFVNRYRIYPHIVEEFRRGIGKNIGIGGICFEGEGNFAVGTNLEIELDMPALDHAVRVIGRLVWVRPKPDGERCVYGVCFLNIKDQDMAAIKKVVETFSKQ